MLVVICIMITVYAIANFVLQYYTQIEVSPTLTTSWFAFWGIELISLAAIKTSKIKHNQDSNDVIVEYEKEEEVEIEE